MGTEAGQRAGSDVVEAMALGVVINVPPPLEGSLRAWRQRYGGDQSALVAPHITLVSGSTTEWEAAVRHVHSVAAATPAFTVGLHGTGTFRPLTPVVYLNVEEGAEACGRLHDALLAGPMRHEARYGYHPHLTIVQEVGEAVLDLAQEELKDESMSFTVGSIGLFGVDSTGAWSLREELGLGGPPG